VAGLDALERNRREVSSDAAGAAVARDDGQRRRLAVIGTASVVTGRLAAYLDAGATDLALVPPQTEPADLQRIWDVAAAL